MWDTSFIQYILYCTSLEWTLGHGKGQLWLNQTEMTGMSALNNTLSLMIKTETVISKKGSWFFVFVVLSFSFSGSQDTLSCTVVVSNKLKTVNISNGFTYKSQLTPVITEVSPRRGGTAGGTSLTITGSGFRCSKSRHSLKSHPYYICVVHSQLL